MFIVESALDLGEKKTKKFGPFLDLCVSSLRRGHANLLCIVPILSDVSEETSFGGRADRYEDIAGFIIVRCGNGILDEPILKGEQHGPTTSR